MKGLKNALNGLRINLIPLLKWLLQSVRFVTAGKVSTPRIPPDRYRIWLKAQVAREEYVPDRYTYCNVFVANVCEQFEWGRFGGLRAGEMTDYMKSHPEHFMSLESHEEAACHACEGQLVIAAKKAELTTGKATWQPSGHVCVVAPERQLVYSRKWDMWCARAANVGASNWYGRSLSWAFKERPDLYLYLG